MATPTSAQRGSYEKCQRQAWVCTTAGVQPFFLSSTATLAHKRIAHGHERPALDYDGNTNAADKTRIQGNYPHTDNHHPLTSEGLRQWGMHAHVDHVFDLVPFWQRGIDAAEKGEVLRLEEFLEKMEGDGGWRTTNEVLGMMAGWKVSPSEQGREYDGGWGQPYRDDWAASQRGAWESNALGWGESQRGGWGVASTHARSDATESSRGRDSGWGIREEWAEGGSDFRRKASATQDEWGARARVVRSDGRREELRHFVDAIARQEAATEERRRQMHLFSEMPLEQKIQKIEETIRILRTRGV